MNYVKNLFRWLPYIYFFIFCLAISNPGNRVYLLIFSIPFVLQLLFQLRYLDMILGMLTFFLALWLMLAYASDLYKVTVITNQSRKFILIGGVLVLSNFAMSILLFRNAVKISNKPKEQNETIQEDLG